MNEDAHVKEQWQLLQSLRSTVEGLLVDGVLNVWNVYGGLNRLHNVMERIFKHGCRIFDQNGEPDCWVFIQGLNWLQPSLATSPTITEGEDYLTNLPHRITSHKDMLWLYKSLENHSLSHKLSWLLSDKQHLLSCLEPWAFLCQENLAEATLLCLRAVERNQPILLTEIDPCLFLPPWISPKASPKRHRRSSSYPINFPSTNMGGGRENSIPLVESSPIDCQETPKRNMMPTPTADIPQLELSTASSEVQEADEIPLKTWNSLPVLSKDCKSPIQEDVTVPPMSIETPTHSNSNSIQSCPIELSKIINVDYADLKQTTPTTAEANPFTKLRTPTRKPRNKMSNKSTTEKSSDSLDTPAFENSVVNNVKEYRVPPHVLDEEELKRYGADSADIKIAQKPKRKTSFLPGSAPEFTASWSREIEGQKDIRTPKKSFMEDGGSSVQPMAIGYFPRPVEGQSLTSFLSSAQFARTNAELDRENAHFSISEAMIAAIEQVKCNRQWRLVEETVEESDEEINNLKQRIRLRRRQRQEERCRGRSWNREFLSDGRTDTTTTDQSVSPLSSSTNTSSESSSTDIFEDLDIDDERHVRKLANSGISMSVASLYSDADLCQSCPKHGIECSLTESSMSAEGVALSLISRFNEKQLPRASELQWLVSEKDAPQRLLPLPKSWAISPDEVEEDTSGAIPLRGTVEWAPPRPQIIFTLHPPPVRRTLIAKQNYRCAGCGMKVAVKYASRFRYCEYLGRYFCTGCHTNQVSAIPGKILSKWDFNRYPVSNFSYRLLDQMTLDPLFQVNDLNPLLYRRIKQLDRTRFLRTQLYYLKDFLLTCRFATSVQEILKGEPNYIISDPHIYSIQDFVHVKCGVLPLKLQELVEACSEHVANCELCQARGFVCEFCCSKDVIFPWELSKVIRCELCGACFHTECKYVWKDSECKRCARLHARRISREQKF